MERIVPAVKTTTGGIQLADLVNGEIAFDENSGILVRKRSDGTALDVYAQIGANTGDVLSSNNLSDLADGALALSNIGGRSAAQVTSEIGTAIGTINLSGLGGLTEAEVDTRAQLKIDALIGSASANYDTFQELQALMEADDTEVAGILVSLGNKITVGATIGGRVIS